MSAEIKCGICKKKLKTIFHGDEIQYRGVYYYACMGCIERIKKGEILR